MGMHSKHIYLNPKFEGQRSFFWLLCIRNRMFLGSFAWAYWHHILSPNLACTTIYKKDRILNFSIGIRGTVKFFRNFGNLRKLKIKTLQVCNSFKIIVIKLFSLKLTDLKIFKLQTASFNFKVISKSKFFEFNRKTSVIMNQIKKILSYWQFDVRICLSFALRFPQSHLHVLVLNFLIKQNKLIK
jgi:hypothetical protein